MNLNINNVNFQGRNEVLYGLKKAAQEAQNIGRSSIQASGPRPLIKDKEIYQAKGALDAYCDMAVKDDWFVETINSISPNVTKEIKETLSPIKNDYASAYPHETFISAIKNAVESAKNNADTSLKNFFEKIKL